jgi:hypothetical protein
MSCICQNIFIDKQYVVIYIYSYTMIYHDTTYQPKNIRNLIFQKK